MKNLARVCVLLLAAISTASCGRTLVTDALKPVDTNTSESVVSGFSDAPYCGVYTSGTNPAVPPQQAVWAGYIRDYDPGTNPFPCWAWSSAVYRGAFRFDLSKYTGKKILSAVLHMSFGQARYASGTVASNGGVWAKTLGLATSTWWTASSPHIVGSQSKLFPWKPIPGLPDLPHGLDPASQPDFPIKYNGANGFQVEISSVVRSWLDGTEPNLGFILIGTNEKTAEKNHDAALSPVSGLSLDITYSIAK